MLKQYCIWESDKLPQGAIKFKVARPSVLGVPQQIWLRWKNEGDYYGGEYQWEDYETDYINAIWQNPKARARLKLIATTANRQRKRDVYLGCYCRGMPCHRFTLLAFLEQVYKCRVDSEAMRIYIQFSEGGCHA